MFVRTEVAAAEEPVRFGAEDLYGMIHHPAGSPRGAVLLCTPDGEERVWSHRTYVQLARALAHRGYIGFRFEYAGHGESAGDYDATPISRRAQDIGSAFSWFARRFGAEPSAVLASRLGVAFALEAASRGLGAARLIFWEPVLEVDGYVRNLIRVNLASQMVIHGKVIKTTEELMAEIAAGNKVSANGYHLTQSFIDGLRQLTPGPQLAEVAARSLIVSTPAGRFPDGSGDVVRMPFLPFWKEPKSDMAVPHGLITRTIDWIDGQSLEARS